MIAKLRASAKTFSLIFFCVLLLIFCFLLLGCGAMLCTKGETNQGLFFNFDPYLKSVDIGAYPTYHSKSSFVKKIIIKMDGFLLIESQGGVHCDNFEEMKKNLSTRCEGHKIVQNYRAIRYTDDTGYEEWDSNVIPEEEWKNITDLHHKFSKPPIYHYKNCRYKFFGRLYQLWQIIKRV